MKTLHLGLRVSDRERSLAFYEALGYEVAGDVPETGLGHLTMLKLSGDEFVTLELVHDPSSTTPTGTAAAESRLSHLVIQVDDMDETIAILAERGVDAEPPTSPDGSEDFRTAWVTDPDGARIELVQWPKGHPAGMTAADFEAEG